MLNRYLITYLLFKYDRHISFSKSYSMEKISEQEVNQFIDNVKQQHSVLEGDIVILNIIKFEK